MKIRATHTQVFEMSHAEICEALAAYLNGKHTDAFPSRTVTANAVSLETAGDGTVSAVVTVVLKDDVRHDPPPSEPAKKRGAR